MVDRKEIGIKIRVDEVLTQTCECVICCDTFKEPLLTKCGHTFCKLCIEEVVNRQKLCPECRAPLTLQDLTRNYQLGVLIEALTRERENEKQRFFQQLADDVELPIEGVNWGPI